MRFHPASADYHKFMVCFDPMTATVALTAAATVAQAAGTIMSGNAANKAAKFEAAQMSQQAGQERATAQRAAIEQRRKAGVLNSRANAVAAASGAGADDPTVSNIESDIAGEGEYNALNSLYQGEERARGLELGAVTKRYQGAQAKQASILSAGGTILSSASSMYQKYGNGGPDLTPSASAFEYGTFGPSSLPWQNASGYQIPSYD